jgi:hypothetical protein
MEFNTTQFECSHGKAPRGRGQWAFGLGRRNPGPKSIFWSTAGVTYSEAKKEALQEARYQGLDSTATIWVLP